MATKHKHRLDDREAVVSSNSANYEPASEWSGHEHVSESVRAQAQKLVEEAGSVELAKHVVDTVAAQADAKQNLAHEFGYDTYEAMTMGSVLVNSNDGKSWFAMLVGVREWIVWNEDDLPSYRRFESELPPR